MAEILNSRIDGMIYSVDNGRTVTYHKSLKDARVFAMTSIRGRNKTYISRNGVKCGYVIRFKSIYYYNDRKKHVDYILNSDGSLGKTVKNLKRRMMGRDATEMLIEFGMQVPFMIM